MDGITVRSVQLTLIRQKKLDMVMMKNYCFVYSLVFFPPICHKSKKKLCHCQLREAAGLGVFWDGNITVHVSECTFNLTVSQPYRPPSLKILIKYKHDLSSPHSDSLCPVLEFLNNLWGLGTEYE